MLPAISRLKKDRDFQRVLSTGEKALFGPLLIFTAPGEAEQARFGLVVSKKVSKKAILRNKIRRQLGELLRPKLLSVTKPVDVVLLVLRPSEFEQYERALTQFIERLHSSR